MKTKILFFSLIIGLFVLTTACNNDDDPKPPTELIGKWKCLGFGNTNGEFREILPNEEDCEKCYTIDFRDNYEFFVKSAQFISGIYSTEKNFLKLEKLNLTEILLEGEALLFSDNLQKVSHYKIQDSKLYLFYSDTEYLLFKPLKN